MKEEQKGEFLIYQSEEGSTKIEVRLENENVWLTQKMIAELFQTSPQNITIHLKNIYEEGELQESSTCKDFLQVQNEGSRQVERKQKFYNLDAIISVGYRIKSHIATSVDYDPNTPESAEFFKMVQNKLHYAAHGHTAAEVIYQRADSDKPFMGLTVFPGEQPSSKDITVAKNYLNAEELKILNNLVSGYFDFAEVQAMKRKPMYMIDYIKQLDNILSATGEKILSGAGSVSHHQAIEKARAEFKKYQVNTLSSVEKDYLESIKSLQKKIDKEGGKNEL